MWLQRIEATKSDRLYVINNITLDAEESDMSSNEIKASLNNVYPPYNGYFICS